MHNIIRIDVQGADKVVVAGDTKFLVNSGTFVAFGGAQTFFNNLASESDRRVYVVFAEEAEAKAFAAEFPKVAKVKVTRNYQAEGLRWSANILVRGVDATTGDVNEAGVKQAAAFWKKALAL